MFETFNDESFYLTKLKIILMLLKLSYCELQDFNEKLFNNIMKNYLIKLKGTEF